MPNRVNNRFYYDIHYIRVRVRDRVRVRIRVRGVTKRLLLIIMPNDVTVIRLNFQIQKKYMREREKMITHICCS
jgi:hypothetical protein